MLSKIVFATKTHQPHLAATLSPLALVFVAELVTAFRPRLDRILADRATAAPAAIREDDGPLDPSWRCDGSLLGGEPRVELVGAADQASLVAAFGAAPDAFVADLDSATAPTWVNLVEAQHNLRRALRGELGLSSAATPITLRPRALHLREEHIRVDGKPVPAALFDVAVYCFHNAQLLFERGLPVWFSLTRMVGEEDAKLWNEVLAFIERSLGLPPSTLKVTVRIDTVAALIAVDAILWQLRERVIAVACDRWDYLRDIVATRSTERDPVVPARAHLGESCAPFLACAQRIIGASRRRGIPSLASMIADTPVDPTDVRSVLCRASVTSRGSARLGFRGSRVGSAALVEGEPAPDDGERGGDLHGPMSRARERFSGSFRVASVRRTERGARVSGAHPLRRRPLVSVAPWLTAIGAALLVAGGCKPVDRTGDVQITAATLDQAAPRSVVLVTIDGVRWEDVFMGVDRRLVHGSALAALAHPFALMPETKALVDGGGIALGGGGVGCGIVAPTNAAVLSLPGYDELLGGRSTACETNDCPRVEAPTVLDAAAKGGKGPVGSIASWGKLARAASNGGGDVFLSAGRDAWPARPENTAIETELTLAAADPPFPGHGDYRSDFHTERLALAYLASRHPRLLHVGLGDTDEYGHRGDYAAYVRAIRSADRFVAEVATLAAAARIPTTVIVTTDHGRDVSFRDHGKAFSLSKRSFVLAFGDGVEHGGNVCQHRDIGLPDVGATVRALLSLPPDGSPGAGTPIEQISGIVASR